MLEIKHQLLLGNKRVLECLLHAVDLSDRHFSSQPRDPFRCRRSRENGVQFLGDLLRFFRRTANLEYSGSVAHSGLPTASVSPVQNFSLLHMMNNQPSLVLFRNRGLGPVAVTVLPVPLARRAATACAAVRSAASLFVAGERQGFPLTDSAWFALRTAGWGYDKNLV
jgi:hypothetical protein